MRTVVRPVVAWVMLACLVTFYLLWLSGAMGIHANRTVTTRVDVLFSSDLSNRLHSLSGSRDATPELREHPYSISHPLLVQTWGTLGGLWRWLLEHSVSDGELPVLAARVCVGSVAGAGIATLLVFARTLIPHGFTWAAVAVMYLLFTATALLAVPEHMGLSSALLTVAFVVTAVDEMPYRGRLLLGLTVLTAATTVTNAALPLGCLLYLERQRLDGFIRIRAVRIAGMVAMLLAAPLAISAYGSAIVQHALRGDTIVRKFLNVRVLESFSAAVMVPVAAVTYPAVGPEPVIAGAAAARRITYEPLTLGDYSFVTGAGAIAWLVLLAVAVVAAYHRPRLRTGLVICGTWLLFNVAFHSVWGDELFLYSPHWSWALAAVVVLGVGEMKPVLVAGLASIVIPAQITALVGLLHSLASFD